MQGTLEKMYIQAYSKGDYSPSSKIGDKFSVQVNPESYRVSYVVEHDDTQGIGTAAANLRFNKIRPPDLSLDVLFDNTGVIKDASTLAAAFANPLSSGTDTNVTRQIETFKHNILDYNGSVHQSNFLKLHWGTLTFKGKVSSMDIEFKLFATDGSPIRAIAHMGFRGSIQDDLRVALEDRQSPDITHRRVFSAFDRFTLMTGDIYGDGAYYIQVARFNHLNSFRKIARGTVLIFPPLQ
jgi:hypothetical protein